MSPALSKNFREGDAPKVNLTGSTSLSFGTEEMAKKALKALKRAVTLAGKGDGDPFAEKPGLIAKPPEAIPGQANMAARRRTVELAIHDAKGQVEQHTKRAESASKTLDDLKLESKKLVEFRRTETSESKRALIIASQLVMISQVSDAAKAKADAEFVLNASKASLAQLERELIGLRN